MKFFINRMKKSEKGAALVVEMTLIFPIVLLVLGVLIYASAYLLQGVTIYNNAQRIAVEAAREIAIPGYDKLHGGEGSDKIYVKADFISMPNEDNVNAMLGTQDAYRYWKRNPLRSGKKESLQNSLIKLVEQTSILADSNVNCEIKTSGGLLGQQVIVHVEKPVPTPDILRFFGITDDLDIHVNAVAVAGDPAEFIRNTDMVFDLIEFAFDRIHINGKSVNEMISEYKVKFDNVKTNLGI